MKKKSLCFKVFRKIALPLSLTVVGALYCTSFFSGQQDTFNTINIFLLIVASLSVSFIASQSVSQFFNDQLDLLRAELLAKSHTVTEKSAVDEVLDLQEFCFDLKAKKNAKSEDLSERLSQYKRIFEGMPLGVLAVDGEMNVIRCNSRCFRLLDQRRPAGAIKGRRFEELFFLDDFCEIVTSFHRGENNVMRKEFDFQSKICINESLRVSAIKLNQDEGDGALFIVENITALRRLENMRSDFVSNVSHELKTPIAIISGFVETLKECLDDPEVVQHFLGIIGKNTKRLEMLIDDLLVLSRLEQGEDRSREGFESRDLNKTVRSAVDLCLPEISSKRISLDLNLEEAKYYKTAKIFANHRLIEQVLRNLIENAVRYSPEKTRVSIAAVRKNKKVEIIVRDSGPGIAPEYHEKVFERFYRIDKSRDRQTGGSGLGLSIVKHIIRLHNGSIRLESEEGVGSTFYVTLPDVKEDEH